MLSPYVWQPEPAENTKPGTPLRVKLAAIVVGILTGGANTIPAAAQECVPAEMFFESIVGEFGETKPVFRERALSVPRTVPHWLVIVENPVSGTFTAFAQSPDGSTVCVLAVGERSGEGS